MEKEKVTQERKKYTWLLIVATALGTIMILLGIYLWYVGKDDNPIDNNGGNNGQQENNNKTNDDNGQQENNNKTNEDNEENYENNLTRDENVESGVYGTAYVEGYAKVVKKPLCDDGPDICQGNEPEVDAISFYVTNRKVNDISGWFSADENGDYISLGCLENGLVSFVAMADEFYKGDNPNSQENYSREIKLSKDDSDKIIASNENNPIILKIEKKKLKKDIRMGLYSCNSLITGVEVIK